MTIIKPTSWHRSVPSNLSPSLQRQTFKSYLLSLAPFPQFLFTPKLLPPRFQTHHLTKHLSLKMKIFLNSIFNFFQFLLKFQLAHSVIVASGVPYSDSSLPYTSRCSSQVPSFIPITLLARPSTPLPSSNPLHYPESSPLPPRCHFLQISSLNYIALRENKSHHLWKPMHADYLVHIMGLTADMSMVMVSLHPVPLCPSPPLPYCFRQPKLLYRSFDWSLSNSWFCKCSCLKCFPC